VSLGLAIAAGSAGLAIGAPAPEELPANTVVVVSHVPLSLGTIAKAEFHHAMALAIAGDGRKSPPKQGGKRFEALRAAAHGELLDGVWVRGQAREMGIAATPRQIARELARIKEENFKSEAEYRRFLRQSHFTRRDLNERVELQLLAQRIQERVSAKGGAKGFSKFVAAYVKRWRARTVCAPGYVTDHCSNGPPLAPLVFPRPSELRPGYGTSIGLS